MPIKRMDRSQFFEKLAPIDDERLRKVLWTLYWRGSAALRERIEAELDPAHQASSTRSSKEPVDPEWVRMQVSEFVELARSGAYLAGDRRVSPRERTRWRFTFHRLVVDAESALGAADIDAGASAVEQLIDLACEVGGYDYFRSEDPIEAARFVVSDAAALLWSRFRECLGFSGFAERAARQLVKWEAPYGWTRTGYGRTSEKETSLASVVARMLPAADMWVSFTDRYLDALDQIAGEGRPGQSRRMRSRASTPQERARALAEWHQLLLDRLFDSEAEDRVDRLAAHPALGGPELRFFQAQLAHRRGDTGSAQHLIYEALEKLPGHPDFLAFAAGIGAAIPARAQQIRAQSPR